MKIAARMMIRPYTTSCQRPVVASMLGSQVKMTAPMNAPIQERDPPMMTIVRASTIRWKLISSGETVVRSRAFIAPAQAPSAPLTVKASWRTVTTPIPMDIDSSGSSRTASIRRRSGPRSVSASRNATTTHTATTPPVVRSLSAPYSPFAPPVSSPPLVASTEMINTNAIVAMARYRPLSRATIRENR